MDLIGKFLGRQFRFKSVNYPDRSFRHRDAKLWLDRCETKGLSGLDSTFTIVPGISGIRNGISFKSENYPDHFIRHTSSECFITNKNSYPQPFRQDATWLLHPGLFNEEGLSFEASNFPGFYMRHKDYRVRIDHRDGSELFNKDATWVPDLLKDVRTHGEWALVHGNDNLAADWKYSKELDVGMEIGEAKTTEKTEEFTWTAGMEAGAEGLGMSVKTMFEVSGMQSVTKVSSSTWQSSHFEKTAEEYSGKKGEGFYLWQWILYASTADGAVITVKTNLYQQTTEHKPPKSPE